MFAVVARTVLKAGMCHPKLARVLLRKPVLRERYCGAGRPRSFFFCNGPFRRRHRSGPWWASATLLDLASLN